MVTYKILEGKKVAVLIETEYIHEEIEQNRFAQSPSKICDLDGVAVYVPDESHVVIDGDLVTARSAADLDAYFDAIVQLAISNY
ncbi:MAG: hypothetical protein QNJ33_10355 [Crocosphaera sp.]|nr:hypothetical protein [Crocosphaera sp.]